MLKDGAKTVTALVLALTIGGGAIAYAGFQIHKLQEIERGPTVDGRATDWKTSPARGRTTYRVKYAFAHDGAGYAGGWVRVPKEIHDDTRAGTPLRVRLAAERPDWHLPESAIAEAKSDGVLLLITGALVLVFVLTALVLMWAAKRRKVQAAARAATPPADNFPKDPPTGST
jgi:hypothetical protein